MSKKSTDKKRTFKDTFPETKANENEPVNKKQKLNNIPKLDTNVILFKYKDYCEFFEISETIARQLCLLVSRFINQFPDIISNVYLTLQLFRKILQKTKWTNTKLKSFINNSVYNFTLYNISLKILYNQLINNEPFFFRKYTMSMLKQLDKKTYLKEFDYKKNGPLYKQKWARANLCSFDYKQMIKEFRKCCICSERKMVDTKLEEEPFRCRRCILEYEKRDKSIGRYIYRFSSLNNMDPGLQPSWAQGL